MRILVTGGAGYVGSHVVRASVDAGHEVVVVDDLSTGHRESVPAGVELVIGDCGDPEVLDRAGGNGVDAVMHMAARCSPAESMTHPERYYDNIVSRGLGLLDWMRVREVPRIVHSSTSSVYGEPETVPIDEDACPRPVSSYGAAKLALDGAIQWYGTAHGFRGAAMRYFNAAGAHPDGTIGEHKTPAYNLVPKTLGVALGGDRLVVYGSDYPTRDGTAVRDYVHVMDLAAAHLRALEALGDGPSWSVFNLGSGTGYTVLEVVEAARRVTGHPIPVTMGERRPGDPVALVAAADRAREHLGWNPRRSSLETILADAWRWHRGHPRGYGGEARPA